MDKIEAQQAYHKAYKRNVSQILNENLFITQQRITKRYSAPLLSGNYKEDPAGQVPEEFIERQMATKFAEYIHNKLTGMEKTEDEEYKTYRLEYIVILPTQLNELVEAMIREMPLEAIDQLKNPHNY